MPFYIKEGNSWIKWDRLAKDILEITDLQGGRDGKILAAIFPREDPEQLSIMIPQSVIVIVTTESDIVLFPGEEGVVNREDIFIKNVLQKSITVIIHSETPIS